MANEELKQQNVNRALETAYRCFLEHGVEFVTREMVARESGISRASLNRYWADKTACVLQTAAWFRGELKKKLEAACPPAKRESMSGLERLEHFMLWCRELYCEEPRNFVLYAEFKVYLHRSGLPKNGGGCGRLVSALGYHPLLAEIFEQGIRDGSMRLRYPPEEEIEFLGDTFLGYLSHLALGESGTGEACRGAVDHYISRVLRLYKA